MLRTDLLEIIRNGENSGAELKRDDIEARALARELVAFANAAGGMVLLGVEDDGTVSGITRSRKAVEEWVMQVCPVHFVGNKGWLGYFGRRPAARDNGSREWIGA